MLFSFFLSGHMEKSIYKNYFDIEALIREIRKYLPNFDKKRFRKAFEFSENAHRNQLRKDGKTPYVVHPVKVVEILSKLHADEDILIAALLHDVPEDTEHDLNEVRSVFGEDVAFLIDGITKLSKVQYQNNMPERQIESLKKLFLHSAKDLRVIIIKLADRLHNMRTLQYVPEEEKRLRIARETLEIFVPLANLLGIQDLKSELEDLCFMYLFPDEYNQFKAAVDLKNEKNKPALIKFINILTQSFKKIGLKAEVTERKQNLYTIHKKLLSKGKTPNELEARIAVRIIMTTIPYCYEALGVVHGLFTPKLHKFKDYIASPKVNKYQSLHTMVFGIDGVLTDIQIRTKEMDLESIYGIVANFFNKDKGKIDNATRLPWVDKIIEMEKMEKTSGDFLEDLKHDVFQDRIFVFTPKGETVDLPRGATVIDFAYVINADIGNHASKSEINGNVMPINTPLKTGDVIKIITDKDLNPSISWMNFAKTSLAKNTIHDYLKKMDKNEKIKEGRNILQKEFDISGLGLIGNTPFKKISAQLTKNFRKTFSGYEELYVYIAEGDIRAVDVAKAIKKQGDTSERGVKVNVKVAARNRFGLLRDVSEVFYKHSIDMTYLKGWSHSKQKEAYFNVQVFVSDIENVGHIFDELEQIDGILYVYRIPNRAMYISYALVAFTIFAWIFHPLIFRWLIQTGVIGDNGIFSDVVIYSGLFVIFFLVLFTTHIVKNYLPFVRKKKLFWIIVFGLPVLAVSMLLFEHFYFNFQLSWLAILIEVLILYLFLGKSFLTFKKIS
ncbi:MAG: RelA/SpoT family protein [Candidatus Peregrinibacteria bacterium]